VSIFTKGAVTAEVFKEQVVTVKIRCVQSSLKVLIPICHGVAFITNQEKRLFPVLAVGFHDSHFYRNCSLVIDAEDAEVMNFLDVWNHARIGSFCRHHCGICDSLNHRIELEVVPTPEGVGSAVIIQKSGLVVK
jgi:hypothetical protein